jgi:sugar lactone lactonase YvrE
VCVCPSGEIFVADTGNHAIRRVMPTGEVTTLAGISGLPGSTDGPGARFNLPAGIDADGECNLFVADTGNHTIRRISRNGVVTTLAGRAGVSGTSDGSGSNARFDGPRDVAVDVDGTIYVADHRNHAIRAVSATGGVTTWAGSPGVPGRVNGSRPASRFDLPWKLTIDSQRALYVSEMGNTTIRRVTSGGVEEALQGFTEIGGRLDVTAGGGAVYFSDLEHAVVRQLTPGFPIVAGSSAMRAYVDGPALDARFLEPAGIATTPDGGLVVVERSNHTVRSIANGAVSTVAGSAPSPGHVDGPGPDARFEAPTSLAIDETGSVYIGESGRIRKVTPGGVTTTVATGLESPSFIAVDLEGNVYASHFFAHTISKVTPNGDVTTLAGATGSRGNVDGKGADARFRNPRGIAVGSDGTVFVGDAGNGAIRQISRDGTVSTVRTGVGPATNLVIDGDDTLYFVAEGIPAVLRRLDRDGTLTSLLTIRDYPLVHEPRIARAPDGTFYLVDLSIHSIRVIVGDSITALFAGANDSPGNRDGTGAEARFNSPRGIAFDGSSGRIYVTDTNNHAIRVGSSAEPVTITAFTANRTFVPEGESATLTWETLGATSASIAPAIGTVPTSGSTTVSIESRTTFVLTASGPGGEASADVTLFPGEPPPRRRSVRRARP